MLSRFIAIGVNQGDAFFLQRNGFTILVDGGRSSSKFPQLFQEVTNCIGVNVLVCTHNDADHANGVLFFLKAGLLCEEVWLPASWADRLEDMLLRPEDFVCELVEEICNLDKKLNIKELKKLELRNSSLLEYIGDRYASEQRSDFESEKKNDKRDYEEKNINRSIKLAIEKGRDIEYLWSWRCSYLFYKYRCLQKFLLHFFGLPSIHHAELLAEALAAGERICQIAIAAFHRGCRIRWFAYNSTYASGGLPGYLVPVNACEVVTIKPRKWDALKFLALTTSNKQSLVFFSPPSKEHPGVLFTADSDLSFLQSIWWHSDMIVTAPHHGSESNAYAYKRFWRETSGKISTIWVRSDGRFKRRPGPSYLSMPQRYCTLCRNSGYPKQHVQFIGSGGKWQPVPGTRKCTCV